jgi:hypothetical protein
MIDPARAARSTAIINNRCTENPRRMAFFASPGMKIK